MKRTYDSSRFVAFFVKAGLVAAIAAVLLAPATIKASDAVSDVEHDWRVLKRTPFDRLPSAASLGTIPGTILGTVPWLTPEPLPAGFKIDTLLGPRFELMRTEIASGGGMPLPVKTSKARDVSSSE